jgi:preprotein translocase subunit SecG
MMGFILFGFIFILIGLAVHVFRWHFLISGYNTMPKEKKANVDIKGLARLIGMYGYINGGIFILAGILYASGTKSVAAPAIILFVVLTFYVLIKSQKYDGNIFDEAGKLRKGAGKQLILPVSIMVIALCLVAIILILSYKGTKVSFPDEGLEIHGMYGELYKWEDIKEVKLMNELPTIEFRANGSALGSKLKGHFRTSELGSVKLFVNKSKPPFIYLETDRGITIFNFDDVNETKNVYSMILKETDK